MSTRDRLLVRLYTFYQASRACNEALQSFVALLQERRRLEKQEGELLDETAFPNRADGPNVDQLNAALEQLNEVQSRLQYGDASPSAVRAMCNPLCDCAAIWRSHDALWLVKLAPANLHDQVPITVCLDDSERWPGAQATGLKTYALAHEAVGWLAEELGGWASESEAAFGSFLSRQRTDLPDLRDRIESEHSAAVNFYSEVKDPSPYLSEKPPAEGGECSNYEGHKPVSESASSTLLSYNPPPTDLEQNEAAAQFLGIIVDVEEHKIERRNRTARLTNTEWQLFRHLFDVRNEGDLHSQLPCTSRHALDKSKQRLNQKLLPLGIEVEANGRGVWRLIEI